MKKLALLLVALLLMSGCTYYKDFVNTHKFKEAIPEPNQKASSGVNVNFVHGEPPSVINGQFLTTLEIVNFLTDAQTLEIDMWQSNNDLRVSGDDFTGKQTLTIEGAQYDEETGAFAKATKLVKSFGPMQFFGFKPGSETSFNAVATYSVVSEGLVLQFCAEDRKVPKDSADSCSYSSRRTGDGFTRNPITIEGFRPEMRSDGKGTILATFYFDVVNKGPGKATGDGFYQDVKLDLASSDGKGLIFDCRKDDAFGADLEEDSNYYGGNTLPLTLYMDNNDKASVTCTSQIQLADIAKKEDFNLEFHLDYEYKVIAQAANVQVKG